MPPLHRVHVDVAVARLMERRQPYLSRGEGRPVKMEQTKLGVVVDPSHSHVVVH